LGISTLSLGACSTEREETTEFFTRYSGVEICPSAQISNVNEETPTGFSGFDIVYEVDIRMDEACERRLRQRLFEMSYEKPACVFMDECTFAVRPDITYTVRKLADRTRFVYRD
jgi:hypothetical protein